MSRQLARKLVEREERRSHTPKRDTGTPAREAGAAGLSAAGNVEEEEAAEDEEEEKEPSGPQTHVSLLDQHSVLKQQALGILSTCSVFS